MNIFFKGSSHGAATVEHRTEVPKKQSYPVTRQTLLCICPPNLKTLIHKGLCTPMFMVTKTGNHRVPSVDGRIKVVVRAQWERLGRGEGERLPLWSWV